MARIAGTCYFKIDGQQLSLTGGIEVPMNTVVNDDIIGMEGSVDRKETHRAPYVKGTFKVPKDFPVNKITTSDQMTITAELANGQVYVLSSAWLHGEANHNAEEGTAELEFHGEGVQLCDALDRLQPCAALRAGVLSLKWADSG